MTPNELKKKSQADFERDANSVGLNCFLHRFVDNSDLMNRGNRGHASLPRQPSDYLVVFKGQTFFAEVKATEQEKFSLSRIEPAQWAAMMKAKVAGGRYYVFIWRPTLLKWSVVNGESLLEMSENNTKSLKIEGIYERWTDAF